MITTRIIDYSNFKNALLYKLLWITLHCFVVLTFAPRVQHNTTRSFSFQLQLAEFSAYIVSNYSLHLVSFLILPPPFYVYYETSSYRFHSKN